MEILFEITKTNIEVKKLKKRTKWLKKKLEKHEARLKLLENKISTKEVLEPWIIHDWPYGTVMLRHTCHQCKNHYNLSCGCCSICPHNNCP